MIQSIFNVEQPEKDIQTDREEAPRFISRNANAEQRTRHYMETRWHDQYSYYVAKSQSNRRLHLRLQLFIAVVAVLVPVLLGFNADLIRGVGTLAETDGWYSQAINAETENFWVTFLNAVPAVLSGLVAVATALENVQNYGNNWRAFQTASDGLERERALFEANSGPYRRNANPYRLFVERTEDVIAQESGRYFARQAAQMSEEAEDDEEFVYESVATGDPDDSTPMFDDVDTAGTAYG